MIRFTDSFAARGVRCAPNSFGVATLAVVLAVAMASHAWAIVPVGKTVAAGGYDAAVWITNAQGESGSGTLFGKMYKVHPPNSAGVPQRYFGLFFFSACPVLRPFLPR